LSIAIARFSLDNSRFHQIDSVSLGMRSPVRELRLARIKSLREAVEGECG
jgi:hypothetical protein